jgi:hypothetical protein
MTADAPVNALIAGDAPAAHGLSAALAPTKSIAIVADLAAKGDALSGFLDGT